MLIAWGVVLGAGLATLACVFILTRRIPSPWWRTLVRCLAAVWLLMPAAIQALPGYYAPAFIVAIFEGLFRTDGQPAPALLVLTTASLIVVVFLLVVLALNARRTAKRASAGAEEKAPSP
jgi:hypothetical protein